MCTVFYLPALRLLSKKRDKECLEQEEIVQTDDMIAVRTVGADYFSLGMNRYGVAFASTAVNSPEWTRAMEQGNRELAKSFWQRDSDGRESATRLVSRMLPQARKVSDVLATLQAAKTSWRGYNVVLMDTESGGVLETFDRQSAWRPLPDKAVVTNHFSKLSHGPRSAEDYPNSFARFDYANEKLATIDALPALFAAIHPQDADDRRRIWRESAFQTISSTVFDLQNMKIYYSGSIDRDYSINSLRAR